MSPKNKVCIYKLTTYILFYILLKYEIECSQKAIEIHLSYYKLLLF